MAEEAQVIEAAKPEVEKKETIAEAMGEKKPEVKEDRSVPEAAFLDLKKENKELRKDLKELKVLIENGGSKAEVTDEIAAIAEEYDLKPDFLKKLAGSIRKDVEKESSKELDSKISDILKPIEAKDRQEKIDKVFDKHFSAAMADMPEFADIVNPAVIKSLSLDASNKDKTFSQLIEDTYGKAVPGKRTLENTKPGGGRAPEGIDFDKARKDSKYFESIMADPAQKKEYNEGLLDRVKSFL